MLLFSTILDINDGLTPDDFIELVIKWNQGSPHANNVVEGIDWQGEHNVRYEYEQRWLQFVEDPTHHIIAARYEKTDENGVIWDSDYVMNFDTMKMAIRLDRSYTEDSTVLSTKFSTPHFISLLIRNGHLANDGELSIGRTASVLADDDLYWMADIMRGEKHYKLPIVYVSRTYDDQSPVDVALMASRLKGVAHVFEQKTVYQNKVLREMTDSQNEYYGAIGIYFPSQQVPHQKYFYRAAEGYDDVLMEMVIRNVIQYSNSQRIDTLYTWQGVKNAILFERVTTQKKERQALEQAHQEAQEELFDTYVNEVGDLQLQLEDLQQQIVELTNANESLRYENQGLRTKMNTADAQPLIYMGRENDLYHDEIKDLLLAILIDARSNVQKDSRRMHILKDIIETNGYKGLAKERADAIKKLFKNYNGINGKFRQDLQAMGFDIAEDGKHYKLTFVDDPRYQITIAKTPSDNRAGRNDAAFICNKVF